MRSIKLYIFLAGFSITGVEMAASRFLAPYFGTSSIVWANVIGVILLAMALGYALGGRIADRNPKPEMMFRIGGIGALVLSLLPFVQDVLLSPLSGRLIESGTGLVLGTFFGTLLLFGLPILFLGMLSPYAVRLISEDVAVLGKRSGSLSFWSTLGSILGIYLTSLYLIPFFGVRESIWLFAVLLLLPSLWGSHLRIFLGTFVLFCISLQILLPAGTPVAFGALLEERESTYQHIKVVEDANGVRYLYFNEGEGIQSIYNPDQPWTGQYYDYIAALPYLERFSEKTTLETLILGYAGGSIGTLLQAHAPQTMDIHIDGVEIDPVVTELSREYFGVKDTDRTMFTMDGRSFVRHTEKKYDVIVVDAYSQEIYIPPHMITIEFFKELADLLTEDGIIVFNLNALDTQTPLFQGMVRTLEVAGLQVQQLPIMGTYNHWVIASVDPVLPRFPVVEDERLQEIFQSWVSQMNIMKSSDKAITFTDNNSPVEMLVHGEILEGLWGRRK